MSEKISSRHGNETTLVRSLLASARTITSLLHQGKFNDKAGDDIPARLGSTVAAANVVPPDNSVGDPGVPVRALPEMHLGHVDYKSAVFGAAYQEAKATLDREKVNVSKTRDVGRLIGNVISSAKEISSALKIILDADLGTIVEASLTVFFAYISRRNIWLTAKEYHSTVRSVIHLTTRLGEAKDVPGVLDGHMEYLKFWHGGYVHTAIRSIDDPPKAPAGILALPSPYVGFLRRILKRAIAKNDISFLYSLDKGSKQPWPKLSEQNLVKKCENHQKDLQQKRALVPLDVLDTVAQVAAEIFGQRLPDATAPDTKTYNLYDSLTAFSPSGGSCSYTREGEEHATFKSGRAAGGCAALTSMMHTDPVLEKAVGKIPSLLLSLNQWRHTELDLAVRRCLTTLTEDVANPDCWNDGKLFSRLNNVEIASLFEPGKIRNITIGNGNLNNALLPLQSTLNTAWKHSRNSTMLTPDLTDAVSELFRITLGTEIIYLVSGDYSAATDKVSRTATIAALEPALSAMPAALAFLARVSFMGGTASYPKKHPRHGVTFQFQEAQLMGHTLSFPLLCVINLAALTHACQVWFRYRTGPDCPFVLSLSKREAGDFVRLVLKTARVNGDDILFAAPQDLRDLFDTSAASLGFLKSPGKNYVSTTHCVINSQFFRKSTNAEGEIVAVLCPYLNQRFGTNANTKDGSSAATPTGVSNSVSQMMLALPWSACYLPVILRRWSFKNILGFTPSNYLPVHLGGLGFDMRLAPHDAYITVQQRLMAAIFIANPALQLFSILELNPELAKTLYNVIDVSKTCASLGLPTAFVAYSESVPSFALGQSSATGVASGQTELRGADFCQSWESLSSRQDTWMFRLMYAAKSMSARICPYSIDSSKLFAKQLKEWKLLHPQPSKEVGEISFDEKLRTFNAERSFRKSLNFMEPMSVERLADLALGRFMIGQGGSPPPQNDLRSVYTNRSDKLGAIEAKISNHTFGKDFFSPPQKSLFA